MSESKRVRPMSARIWFWKPQWHWFGWATLVPFSRGGDEWDWHTVVIGWTVTGRVIVAVRRCPRTGRCADVEPGFEWPEDPYAREGLTDAAETATWRGRSA